ncbi:glycoside hydrolase family 104 protein [Acinetobacter baumannii]|uniref:glycoside hydrolase family 24 protein n=1 Tax=Acinetobacter baumannii TaxID=470 RepID=UPI00312C8A58
MATRQQLEQALSNPNVRKMLNLIANTEGVKHGYNTLFGNERINDLSNHPNIRKAFTQTDGKKNYTTAAGRYQFIKDTWDGVARQYGLDDFGPRNQDIGAIALIAQNGALDDVLKGNYQGAIRKLGGTWASLPSSTYAQPKKSWAETNRLLGGSTMAKGSMNDLHQLIGGAKITPASSTGRQLRPGFASDIPPELRNTSSSSNIQKASSQKQNLGSMEDLHNLMRVKDLGKQEPIKVKAKPPSTTESFILGAVNDIGGGINQATSKAKDVLSEGFNSIFGTNLDTNRYEKVTQGTKALNDEYEGRRKAYGDTGIDTARIAGSIAASLPFAVGSGGTSLAGMTARGALQGAGIGGVTFAEDGDKRIQNIKGGAIGGALGGAAGKGINKIAEGASQKLTQRTTQKALDAPRNQLTSEARKLGFTVPPNYSNPNFLNKSLAKVAGEADISRMASIKNQNTINDLAKKSIGIPKDQPITPEILDQVRSVAGKHYEVLKNLGEVKTDKQYLKSLNKIAEDYSTAGSSFNVENPVLKIIDRAKVGGFSTDSALAMIRLSRQEATQAFRQGDNALGMANRGVADALEKQLERSLAQNNSIPKAALHNYINARKVIAKTYTIEDALNEVGDVSAIRLAQMLKKKPLSGELKQAAQFGATYPNLARVPTNGGGGIGLFDALTGVGGAATLGGYGAALGATRPALRYGLTSQPAGKLMGTPSYNSKLLEALSRAGIISPYAGVAGANTQTQ